MFHAGRGCCAGHLERHEESLDALRRAVDLEPGNQAYVNDLGWSKVLPGVSRKPSDISVIRNIRIFA
jgi:Flp pilus assembly protein TadD